MHNVEIRPEIIERVMERRKKVNLFDRLGAKETALVVIDMQNTFCAPGAPAEVPESRSIVANINRLAGVLRERGGTVIWVSHANLRDGARSDWDNFFDHFVADDLRQQTIESLSPDGDGQRLWGELDSRDDDVYLTKNRYSALIPGSSQLERVLRGFRIHSLLIAGTKTNVCCESTARDAMMMDFKVTMVSDATAALSDDEHRATLETFIQQFGDVRTTEQIIQILA